MFLNKYLIDYSLIEIISNKTVRFQSTFQDSKRIVNTVVESVQWKIISFDLNRNKSSDRERKNWKLLFSSLFFFIQLAIIFICWKRNFVYRIILSENRHNVCMASGVVGLLYLPFIFTWFCVFFSCAPHSENVFTSIIIYMQIKMIDVHAQITLYERVYVWKCSMYE